jgi:ferric-dicitrate binding protein FerR (iron transport regulator)/TolA-binding protein
LASGGAERKGERAAADLLARLPELDADRIARERVWREVVETLPASGQPKRRWVPILAMAGATAVALVLVLRMGFSGDSGARLELAAGKVLAAAPEHDWVPARAGASLPEATRLRTDDRSRAVVALSRSAVLIDPVTDLGLESLHGKTFLRLSGGAVVAEVEHRQPGESFVVQTTRYRVTVKGTIFSVRERAPDDVTVSVSRGRVEVAGEGGVWQVPALHSWNSRRPANQGPDVITDTDRLMLLRGSADGPRALIEVEGQVQGDGLEVSEGGLDLGPAPVSWNAPVGHYHFVGKAEAGQAEADASASAGSSATVTLAVAAAVVPAPAPIKEPALPEVPKAPTAPACVGAACVQAPLEMLDQGSPVAGAAEPIKTARKEHVRRHEVRQSRREPVGEAAPPETPTSTPTTSNPTSTSNPTPTLTPEPMPVSAPLLPKAEPELLARLDKPVPPEPAAPVAPEVTATPTAPSPPVVMAPDPYSQAVTLSRSGQYDAAAQTLEAIAGSHGQHADLALYDLARLRQRHLGDPVGALAALVRYEKEYPHGSLTQEVELSAIELDLGRSDFPAALVQMNRFLDEHPDSERAPEVHLLRGNVLRGRGDCQGALREYRRARGDGVEDDAIYFTAFCQQKLGRQDDAAESLHDYLRLLPNGHHVVEVRAALQGR